VADAASPASGSVVYILPDRAGGVFTVVHNLLRFRASDRLHYAAVLTRDSASTEPSRAGALPVAHAVLEYDAGTENLYAIMRRLRDAVPPGPGAIIANDWLELATAATYDMRKAVVTITHGDYDYYYDLAVRYQDAIDVFIAHTRHIHDQLRERLPHRAQDIVHVRYGVQIPAQPRAASTGALRVLFAGRFDDNKGVRTLPAIAGALRDDGADVLWTLIGDGPDREDVARAWPHDVPARWLGQLSLDATIACYASQDVLILPSRNEGLPAVVLEAGAAGVVPVVSDLRSGIPEVVVNGVTGFRVEASDTAGFARAIASLSHDRVLLEAMSGAVRARVADEFDIGQQAPEYQRVIGRAIDSRMRRAARLTGPLAGSRLDRSWLPASLVRYVRSRKRLFR
jgi:glycosyltransferase involved in cell wall biosynthesis